MCNLIPHALSMVRNISDFEGENSQWEPKSFYMSRIGVIFGIHSGIPRITNKLNMKIFERCFERYSNVPLKIRDRVCRKA